MKLGIVCHPTYGGSGVIASELGLALARKGGYEVHFVSHELPFRVPSDHPDSTFHKVDVTSYPLFKYPPYGLALASKLFEICSSTGLDILHVHYAIPHAIAAYLCRQLLGKPQPRIVTTLHGTDITLIGIDASFHAITRFSINSSDAVTAVSSYLAEETKRHFQPEIEVQVIPNFVDPAVFTPALRREEVRARYAAPDEKLLGHLSNFRPVKRIPDVIRAFYLVQKRVPARLLMVGDGPEREPARHLAAELGIEERVSFLGPVRNTAEVLAQLDLFLLPSEYESFGLAALEAMACGVPVVSSRAGGIPEAIEDGVAGVLCPVGDYRAMAAAAAAILKDGAHHAVMARAARQIAAGRFSLDGIVGHYEKLYRRLLERS